MTWKRALILITLLLAKPTLHADGGTWERPDLGAETRNVSQWTYSNSRMKLQMHEGTAAPILVGGKNVGLYIRGRGEFTYTSDHLPEVGLLLKNLDKNTSIKPERVQERIVIRETFTNATIWQHGLTLPEPVGTADAELAAAFSQIRFDVPGAFPPVQLLTLQAQNTPSRPAALIEINGKHEGFQYLYDPVQEDREGLGLVRVRHTTTYEFLEYTPLSSIPIGWSERAFHAPPFSLAHVDLDLRASSGDGVEYMVTETLVANRDGFKAVALELRSRFLDWNGAGKTQARHLQVVKVENEAGQALQFHHADDQIVVILPKAMRLGERVKLRFSLKGDILIHRRKDEYWELGVTSWFPQPALGGQYYTMAATIRVPEPYVPLASGSTVSRTKENGMNVLRVKLDKPTQFFTVMGGNYKLFEKTKGNRTIRVATYAMENSRSETMASLAEKIIEFYETILGPFPYPEFTIIQKNEYGHGQAPPGMMLITNEAFSPTMGLINQFFSQGVNHRFAHEIAHQYWAHHIKMGSDEEQWITESFAEFCSALVIRVAKGDAWYHGMAREWRSRAEESAPFCTIPLVNRLATRDDFTKAAAWRTGLLYNKGPFLLYDLNRQLGDKGMLTYLKAIQAIHAWEFVTTEELAALLSRLTKKDFKPFFESYYWGYQLPPP